MEKLLFMSCMRSLSSAGGVGVVESWECLLQEPYGSSAALDQAPFGFA